jgi:hypothetical protein
LRGIRQEVKTALPKFVHGEHFMRSISVVIKRLYKD